MNWLSLQKPVIICGQALIGDFGSRKYLIASLDQSLKRMGLEYVDIFYSHRPDPNTPVEETMMALDHIVRSGKALYAGISNYNAAQTRKAAEIPQLGTPCLIHQPRYSMLDRWWKIKQRKMGSRCWLWWTNREWAVSYFLRWHRDD